MSWKLRRLDAFNAWAWKNIAMTFGWYLVIGSVAHALLWMALTLLGVYVLSTGTWLFFVAFLAAYSLVSGYRRAGAKLRGELVHFYGELANELVTAAIRQTRLNAERNDFSLEDIRAEARKALSRELGRTHYETIDKREMLEQPFAGAIHEIRRKDFVHLGV